MWLGIIKYLLLCAVIALSQGCASSGSYTPDGIPVTDFETTFAKGEIRLNCLMGCVGTYGNNQQKLKSLHDAEQWHKLAQTVSGIGFRGDQEYYYLGRAAEGLGHMDAAQTYYKIAKAERFKCGGKINTCDGFVFPKDIDERLAIIQERSRSIYQESFHVKKEIKKSSDPEITKAFNAKDKSKTKLREKTANNTNSISLSTKNSLSSNNAKDNTRDYGSNQNTPTNNSAPPLRQPATKQPPAKAGGFELRTESPDTRRLNDASIPAPSGNHHPGSVQSDAPDSSVSSLRSSAPPWRKNSPSPRNAAPNTAF